MATKDYLFFGFVIAFLGIVLMINFADLKSLGFWLGFLVFIGGAFALWKYGTADK